MNTLQTSAYVASALLLAACAPRDKRIERLAHELGVLPPRENCSEPVPVALSDSLTLMAVCEKRDIGKVTSALKRPDGSIASVSVAWQADSTRLTAVAESVTAMLRAHVTGASPIGCVSDAQSRGTAWILHDSVYVVVFRNTFAGDVVLNIGRGALRCAH